MPRPPRVQFAGAIYHILTRGDGRRTLFHDEGHYQRFSRGLKQEVQRSAWEVIAYCWMPNHIHLLLRTPQPNLARGMQHWLSGYANWYAKRNRRSGHLYQGRYKSLPVESDSYYWTLSRYIHLNPCRGARPLAESPDGWPHSSYRGYARSARREEFVAYQTLFSAWQGECGGKDPAAAYRRYVREGLDGVWRNPLKSALREWVIGSEDFLKRMIRLADGEGEENSGRWMRRLGGGSVEEVIETVADLHQVDPAEYVGFRSPAAGREMAALLCRRYTSASLAELSARFGLNHPSSAASLIRRGKEREESSSAYRRRIRQVESRLAPKTKGGS